MTGASSSSSLLLFSIPTPAPGVVGRLMLRGPPALHFLASNPPIPSRLPSRLLLSHRRSLHEHLHPAHKLSHPSASLLQLLPCLPPFSPGSSGGRGGGGGVGVGRGREGEGRRARRKGEAGDHFLQSLQGAAGRVAGEGRGVLVAPFRNHRQLLPSPALQGASSHFLRRRLLSRRLFFCPHDPRILLFLESMPQEEAHEL